MESRWEIGFSNQTDAQVGSQIALVATGVGVIGNQRIPNQIVQGRSSVCSRLTP